MLSSNLRIDLLYTPIEIPFRSLSHVFSTRQDICPEKEYSLRIVLEVYLLRVKSECEMTHEKCSNIRDTSLQVFSIMMDEDEVIDISAIVVDF